MNTLGKLTLAAQAVEDAKDIYSIKVEARNTLVCQALDEGYEGKQIAAICHLSHTRPMQIAAEVENRKEELSHR